MLFNNGMPTTILLRTRQVTLYSGSPERCARKQRDAAGFDGRVGPAERTTSSRGGTHDQQDPGSFK